MTRLRARNALRLAVAVVLACGGPLALAAVGPTVAGAQAEEPVTIVNFEYQPGQVVVPLGTTVAWTNTSDRPHTVTDRGGTFDTDPIPPGGRSTLSFNTPGTYHVFCRINPSKMNGIIVVDAGNKAPPTARIEAIDPALEGETLRFESPVLTVRAGTTLTFANVGGKPHTLTADDGSFDTGVVPPGPEGGRFAGSNATFSLATPGTFNFHCEIHPAQMKGTITVVGEAPATAGPGPPSVVPTKAAVEVVDFAFKDAQVSVAPGGEVTFRNAGQAPHTATFDDVPGDTGTMQPGASGKLTAPTKPGSYSYRCTIHPARMRAVLVVVGQNTADPVAASASAKPPVVVGSAGSGGGVNTTVLVTGVLGAFLGGLGIGAFVHPRRRRTAPKARSGGASAGEATG